jgi:hypothetical protein
MEDEITRVMLRFYKSKDADLIAWYDDLPPRKKGEIIKDVLRRQLSLTKKKETPQLDASNLLADIRQIVDVAIKSALEEYALPSEKKATDTKEDTEADDLLNALVSNSKIELEDDAPEPKKTGWGDSW